jgi:hypothetical protein
MKTKPISILLGGIVAVIFVLLLIGYLYSGKANPPVAVANSSEVAVIATVLSIDLPNPRDLIDASEDYLEIGKCWVVKVAVNRSLRGEVKSDSLLLLVHSPSQSFGVNKKGQTFELHLAPATGPAEFREMPGRTRDPSEIPDTHNRMFKILGTVP